jgi:hypothetical protein
VAWGTFGEQSMAISRERRSKDGMKMTIARFPLGQIVATPGALGELERAGESPSRSGSVMSPETGENWTKTTGAETKARWYRVPAPLGR